MSPKSFAALAAITTLLLTVLLAAACESNSSTRALGSVLKGKSAKANAWEADLGPVPNTPISAKKLYTQINLKRSFIAKGRYSRRRAKSMKPTYITIHSTQNYSGDAWDHAKALNRGALRGGLVGYLGWHFTVQEDVAIQHTPTSEQGHHADIGGPGNKSSIGIEMCEHRGNDLAQTLDRTAKLTAHLMHTHDIPLSRVVPHYHWPRKGYKPPNKNCPHFLLENGKPGATWAWFISRVGRHHERLKLQSS
ncbi:MAG: N-acetylmuramoyl-L-alanine amidase [Verrucomicrobiota bacterium]